VSDDAELVGPFTRKALRDKILEAYAYGANPWADPAENAWADADIDALVAEAPKQLQDAEFRVWIVIQFRHQWDSDVDEIFGPFTSEEDATEWASHKYPVEVCEVVEIKRPSDRVGHEQNVKPLTNWPEDV
jgi:hypothetical protein